MDLGRLLGKVTGEAVLTVPQPAGRHLDWRAAIADYHSCLAMKSDGTFWNKHDWADLDFRAGEGSWGRPESGFVPVQEGTGRPPGS